MSADYSVPLPLFSELRYLACQQGHKAHLSNMNNSDPSSKPVFFTYPGQGEALSNGFHYSQAVRIGNRIEISGQGTSRTEASHFDRHDLTREPSPDSGGWDPASGAIPSSLTKEIEQAFSNVELALQAASPDPSKKITWRQVYSARSFNTPASLTEEGLAATAAALRKFCGPDHRPLLTAVGTPQLALPGMNIEIEVVALVDLNN